MEKTLACKDESYEVTGKVCPPKMPMDNVVLDNWQSLPPSFLDSLFTESSIEGSKIIHSSSLCALLSQASVVLSSDGLSHSSVSLPYYFCNFCDHNTASKLNLLKHIAGKHVFKCHLCDEFISFTRCGLIQHQLQKHVDAEEMQPVLSAKTVQLSTSELLRNIKFLNQFSLSLTSPAGDSINSSLSNGSLNLNTANNFLTSIGSSNDLSSMENKDPDTSSMTQFKSNEKIGFGKVNVENIFEDPKIKIKFGRKASLETVAQTTVERNRKFSNINQLQEMPHFLNDSDSSVTSSSSRRFSLSPPSTYRCLQDTSRSAGQILNGESAEVPTFLTELTSSKKTNLQLAKTENQLLKSLNTTQKMSKWNDETENIQEMSVKDFIPDKTSPLPNSLSALCSQNTTITQKNESREREGSLSPNLSSLSVERLQKQLEDAVSNSPGFIFKETGKTSPGISDYVSDPHQITSCKDRAPTDKVLSIKTKGADFVNCIPGNKVDNFLLDNEEQGSLVKEDVFPFTSARSNSGSSHESIHKSQPLATAKLKMKCENYDLLRNLLVQKPKDTAGTHCNGNNESKLRFKNDNIIPTVPNDLSSKLSKTESNSSSTCWPRASDMTLKELLTGSVPHSNSGSAIGVNKDVCVSTIPIYLVCGICNYEFHNKCLFDKHVETCKKLENCQKESKQIDQNNSNSMASYVECDRAIKQEHEELDHSFTGPPSGPPSGEFTASGLLKSLKDQCLESNLKIPKHDMDFHNSDTDSMSSFYDSHSNKTDKFPAERKFGTGNGYERNSSARNGNLCTNQHSTTQNLSPNFIFADESSSAKKDTSNSIKRKRRHDDDEDADYVYESDPNSESDNSSDSDYRLSSERSLKNKDFDKESYKKMREMPKRVCKLAIAKQPNFYLTCIHCIFSTGNKTEMRQHLISKHSNNVPFCKATFQAQKESLLYFCCGIHSSCTFFSIEGAEIFQHIKLCYSGHLDNFLDNKDDQVNNYAQVLRSLAFAAKKLDSTRTVFYCLRCSFSNCNLQSVAYHAKMNHPDKVAGVMFINRMLPETRVLMVCLVCNSHVPVKQWATHRCRKINPVHFKGNISISSIATLRTLKETTANHMGTEQGKHSLLCELMAAEKGKIVQCCGQRNDKINADSTSKATNNCQSDPSVCLNAPNPNELIVKQEVVDVEDSNDVPVYFSNDNLTLDNSGHSSLKIDKDKGNQMFLTESSTKEPKDLNHSLVLQNLLSNPAEAEVFPKNNSLLQNLLRSPQMVKEQSSSKPLMNAIPAQPAHSKFSSMLETLSRQANQHTPIKLSINSNGVNKNSPPLKIGDTRGMDAFQKVKQVETLKPDSTIQRAITHRLIPNGHTPPLLELGTDAAQLSPTVTPRSPLLPLIPPLSPSQCEENQSSHAPFSNLLRGLLCKVNPKPSNSQNDPVF